MVEYVSHRSALYNSLVRAETSRDACRTYQLLVDFERGQDEAEIESQCIQAYNAIESSYPGNAVIMSIHEYFSQPSKSIVLQIRIGLYQGTLTVIGV